MTHELLEELRTLGYLIVNRRPYAHSDKEWRILAEQWNIVARLIDAQLHTHAD